MKDKNEKGQACGCAANLKKNVQNMVDNVEKHSPKEHDRKQKELDDTFEKEPQKNK